MYGPNKYHIGDKIQFLDIDSLKQIVKKYHNLAYRNSVLSLADEVFTINIIGSSYVALAETDERIMADRMGKKYVYYYEMFEPYEDLATLNNNIETLFGSMNYE